MTPIQICAILLTRNEADRIVKCLDSAKHLFDMISIVDLNSKDNTKEVILEWCRNNNKPVLIHDKVVTLEPTLYTDYLLPELSGNYEAALDIAKRAWKFDYFLYLESDFLFTSKDFDRNTIDTKYGSYAIHCTYFDFTEILFKVSLPWKFRTTLPDEWYCEDKYETYRIYPTEGGCVIRNYRSNY